MSELEVLGASYAKLEEYLQKYDPIRLLSQLSLTYLWLPEGQCAPSSPDTNWPRWIEFVTELALTRQYPLHPETFIDPTIIVAVEKLLKDYFGAAKRSLVPPLPDAPGEERQVIALETRAYSLLLEDEVHPRQFLKMACSLYSEHDDWFQAHLGFRISDAITIYKCIETELHRRVRGGWNDAGNKAKQMIETGRVPASQRVEAFTRFAWTLFYGRSDELLSFTPGQISALSRCPLDICLAFLKRMSQGFGHVNTSFPSAFQDPQQAPWDYRSLSERPIVARCGRYFVLTLLPFPQALLQTFYYDLIGDRAYWEGAQAQHVYGRRLESITADYLRRVFPAEEVFLNPMYSPGGKRESELCDILVLHGEKVLIVQCKTKRMRFESLTGRDYEKTRDDLMKGIGNSFQEGVNAYNYLKECKDKKHLLSFTSSGKPVTVDVTNVANSPSDVLLISVVLKHYQDLTTRMVNTNELLKLFPRGSYPLAIALPDLDVLTQVLDTPALFLHYATGRVQLERKPFVVIGSELTMLEHYVEHGFYSDQPEDQVKQEGFIGLAEFRAINQYLSDEHADAARAFKLRQHASKEFWEYLDAVEQMKLPHAIDCAMFLLGLPSGHREVFVRLVSAAKAHTMRDGQPHGGSAFVERLPPLVRDKTGWCFLAMDTGRNQQLLWEKLAQYKSSIDGKTGDNNYVAFGCDVHSGNLLDAVLFA